MIQSLLATCSLHGVDPCTDLVDVLQRIGKHPSACVIELTPGMWQALFAEPEIQQRNNPKKNGTRLTK